MTSNMTTAKTWDMELRNEVLLELAAILPGGQKAVEKLVEHFGGQNLYIPKTNNVARDKAICRAANMGLKPGRVALKFGLSEQRIRDIVRQGVTQGMMARP